MSPLKLNFCAPPFSNKRWPQQPPQFTEMMTFLFDSRLNWEVLCWFHLLYLSNVVHIYMYMYREYNRYLYAIVYVIIHEYIHIDLTMNSFCINKMCFGNKLDLYIDIQWYIYIYVDRYRYIIHLDLDMPSLHQRDQACRCGFWMKTLGSEGPLRVEHGSP